MTNTPRTEAGRLDAVRKAPLLSDLRDAICFVERHDHPDTSYCNVGRAQAHRIREALIARYQYQADGLDVERLQRIEAAARGLDLRPDRAITDGRAIAALREALGDKPA